MTTRAGDEHSASAVVLAAPLNTWSDISFSPALGEEERGRGREACRALREDLGSCRGTRRRTSTASAGAAQLNWLSTEFNLPEGSLLVGFGCSPDDLDVIERRPRSPVRSRSFPQGAEVVATDAHDWNADEFSQGTWMAYRPGQVMRCATALQETEGRIAFAGSDLRIRLDRMDRRRNRERLTGSAGRGVDPRGRFGSRDGSAVKGLAPARVAHRVLRAARPRLGCAESARSSTASVPWARSWRGSCSRRTSS